MVYGLVLQRTVFALLWAAWLCGCEQPAMLPLPPPEHRQVCAELLGVCFEIPVDWQRESDQGVFAFHGTNNTEHEATLSLQAIISPNLPLDATFEAVAAPTLLGRHNERLRQQLLAIQDAPAILELVEQDHMDHRLRRGSLYLDVNGFALVLSYVTLARDFDRTLWAFDHAVNTLCFAAPPPVPNTAAPALTPTLELDAINEQATDPGE